MKENIEQIVEKKAIESESKLQEVFSQIDLIERANTKKVMDAFIRNRISETHFAKTTGYGYNDIGREMIEKVYADIFNAEDALVRIQFVNGTHALSTAILGNMRCKDRFISVTGAPYDTLHSTIGIEENPQSLISSGVEYYQIELQNDNFNYKEIESILKTKHEGATLVFIGRSRGYDTRRSLDVKTIAKAIDRIKKIDNQAIVMVDNSYGEFVETIEPTDVGADIVAGSLIKNIGGGICETGGYIVGKHEYINKAAERLTAPGIGKECGASLGKNKEILQGLFMAPHVVANALKSACFTASLMEQMGYIVSPKATEQRTDIVQMIEFRDKEKLISFIQGIQTTSPVDSFVLPVPWDMPGYTDQVIMAAGTFVSGASIELSADGPVTPPYVAYIQGGLTYESARYSIINAIVNVLKKEEENGKR